MMTHEFKSGHVLDSGSEATGPLSAIRIRIGRRFEEARRQVTRWVDDANRVTEREVLAAGDAVSRVVIQSREQAGTLSRLSRRVSIDEDGRASVSTAIALQAAAAREMVGSLSGHTERLVEQSAASQECVELISRVSTRIDLLARESNILSLNARIEAARAGAQGSAFQVVAGEMNRLSQQVAKANAEVLDLAERLGELLPAVASSALLARRETERLGETTVRQGLAAQHALGELQADVGKAIADSERSVDDVLRLSQAALSHLQFQDVVSQSLRSIDAVIHGVAVDALDALGPDLGSTSVSPPAYTTLGLFMDDSAESNGLANGEVILF